MRTILCSLFALLALSLTSCETARSVYDNYPGGTYSYTTPDGRLITVTVGAKTPANTAK